MTASCNDLLAISSPAISSQLILGFSVMIALARLLTNLSLSPSTNFFFAMLIVKFINEKSERKSYLGEFMGDFGLGLGETLLSFLFSGPL